MNSLPNELMSANGDLLVDPALVKELNNTIIVDCGGRLELVSKSQISKPAKRQVLEENKRIVSAFLQSRGLTKKAAAKALGINYRTFTAISNGEMLPSKRMTDILHSVKCMVKREIR